MTITTAPTPTMIANVVFSHAGPSGPLPGADQCIHPITNAPLSSTPSTAPTSTRRGYQHADGPVSRGLLLARPTHARGLVKRATVRVVDILDWLLWPALAAALLEAFAVIRGIRRLREAGPAVRTRARLGLLDSVASLLIVTGLLLGMKVEEPWLWLSFTGFTLLTLVYAVKGLRLRRARRTAA